MEREILTLAAAAERSSAPSDVIVVYGFDWNPTLPYYAHRKALMDPWSMPVTSPRFLEAMGRLRGQRIGAMVIFGPQRTDSRFVGEHAEYYGLRTEPVYRNLIGDIYAKGPQR